MPDDLLRHVIGPAPVGWVWVLLAIVLTAVLVGWYTAVFVFTSTRRAGPPRVVERARDALLRRRYAARARRIGGQFAAGELADAPACAALSETVRDFLHAATGVRVPYMQLDELAASDLAAAAPLLARLNDVQFSTASTEDVASLSGAAEELILSWT